MYNCVICAHFSPQNEFWSTRAVDAYRAYILGFRLAAPWHVQSKGTFPSSQVEFGLLDENSSWGSEQTLSHRCLFIVEIEPASPAK